jgi:hypothetical protein
MRIGRLEPLQPEREIALRRLETERRSTSVSPFVESAKADLAPPLPRLASPVKNDRTVSRNRPILLAAVIYRQTLMKRPRPSVVLKFF